MKSPLNPLGIEDNRRVFNVKVDGECFSIDLEVPFLEPGHSKDNLGMRETNNHEFNHVNERPEGEGDDSGPTNSSFHIRGSINIVSCDGRRYFEQFEDSNR